MKLVDLYFENSKLKKTNKILFISVLLLFILSILQSFVFLTQLPTNKFVGLISLEKQNVTISYEGLSSEEEEYSENIINNLNPLFLSYQKEIIITKNFSGICNDCELSHEHYSGLNLVNKGIIYIKYNKNTFRNSLCHELLHTLMYVPQSDYPEEDDLHAIIYLLGNKEVCFEK